MLSGNQLARDAVAAPLTGTSRIHEPSDTWLRVADTYADSRRERCE